MVKGFFAPVHLGVKIILFHPPFIETVLYGLWIIGFFQFPAHKVLLSFHRVSTKTPLCRISAKGDDLSRYHTFVQLRSQSLFLPGNGGRPQPLIFCRAKAAAGFRGQAPKLPFRRCVHGRLSAGGPPSLSVLPVYSSSSQPVHLKSARIILYPARFVKPGFLCHASQAVHSAHAAGHDEQKTATLRTRQKDAHQRPRRQLTEGKASRRP